MDKKLVVCDVCDTLFKSNTTFDFILYVIEKKKKHLLFFFYLLTSKKSPLFFVLIIIGKIGHWDLVKNLALKFLKGMPFGELNSLAETFYFDFLVQRSNEHVFKLLPTENHDGTVLLSSSIDIVVSIIAKENNLNFESSRLEWHQGNATGNLEIDLTGQKHEIAKRIAATGNFNQLQVITDNRSDWELVKLADERFVIIKEESEKVFWHELRPSFIEV